MNTKKIDKPIILSGIQPSGNLCLGNYLGAIKNWVNLQNDYDSIFVIVDMHSITVKQNPAELRKRCLSFAAQFLASGVNPKKSSIFIQSHVPQHAELSWVLNCYSYMGELNRMTQYKDKIKNINKNINVGLFTYPILMASDILLYQANLVPVGSDQKQHLELARDLANRFNNQYSQTFTIPKPYIPKVGARIMSLLEPNTKMSKSDKNDNNIISILDKPDIVCKKIKKAVTDSESTIRYDDERLGLKNLINIYSILTKKTINKIESDYDGKGYKEFKDDLSQIINDTLNPIQKEYYKIIKNKKYLENILKVGAEKSSYRAMKTLRKVYKKIGFLPKFI